MAKTRGAPTMVSAGPGKGSEVVPWLTVGRRDPGHVRVRGPLSPATGSHPAHGHDRQSAGQDLHIGVRLAGEGCRHGTSSGISQPQKRLSLCCLESVAKVFGRNLGFLGTGIARRSLASLRS